MRICLKPQYPCYVRTCSENLGNRCNFEIWPGSRYKSIEDIYRVFQRKRKQRYHERIKKNEHIS